MVKKWTKGKGFIEIREGIAGLQKGDRFFTVDGGGESPVMIAESNPYYTIVKGENRLVIKSAFLNDGGPNGN